MAKKKHDSKSQGTDAAYTTEDTLTVFRYTQTCCKEEISYSKDQTKLTADFNFRKKKK